MAAIQIRELNFTYPMGETPALKDVNLTVEPSSFTVVCGKSGCGKSTLLRQLKKNLTPFGEKSGQVLYDGQEIGALPDRVSVTEIGFVQQNPDNQLVTDKVWHELAFGLESLGLDNSTIRRRVAEMASFFDMQSWFRKGVSELSGGQKQLLNLASVMAMQPKVLILDEPTSQLDPIAAEEFLKTVYKINRDLGTTVIISEHRLEDLFPMADQVVVMDGGRIVAADEPRRIAGFLAREKHPMFYGLPAVMKIYAGYCYGSYGDDREEVRDGGKDGDREGSPDVARDGEGQTPLTIREGRLWIEGLLKDWDGKENSAVDSEKHDSVKQDSVKQDSGKRNPSIQPAAITVKDVWFQYSRQSGQVLRGLNLQVEKGELFCLLGGNGVGKSTTLKAVSGLIQPQRGRIAINDIPMTKENRKKLLGKTIAMVPQNPQALFTEITVEEELAEALYDRPITDMEKAGRVADMLEMMEISHLKKSHPYDLSGGEQQRLALGKILLLEPEILLMDEPTKGLDPFFKLTLAGIFQKLKNQGVTLFMVSHDIEFCAAYGDRCAMFFDGDVVSCGLGKEFFSGNSFYTTTANRMVRQWNSSLITWEEVCQWLEQVTIRTRREP